MDRSFLSDSKVIAASRELVCVRLATYESKEEAEVLKSIFIGRSGELENTTFALMTPRGERTGRAGRTPGFLFHGPADLAEGMQKLARDYPSRKEVARELPIVKNSRLALDVAACDGLPLALVFSPDKDERAAVEGRLARAAWSDGLQGAFIYASVSESKELAAITSASRAPGVLVVEPDTYGLAGKELAAFPANATAKELEDGLVKVRVSFTTRAKDPRRHIQEGRRLGIDWKTEIPDTDPGPGGNGGPPRPGGPGGR